MIHDQSYRNAFIAALFFHCFLAFMLLAESSNTHPTLVKEVKNEPGELMALDKPTQPKQDIVQAVSVDNKEIMETVNRIKNERAMQLKAEQSRQQALAKQATMAKMARQREQQQLAKLKAEAAKLAIAQKKQAIEEQKLAIARKKQIQEEQKHLKELALQKEQETQRIKELRSKQALLKQKEKQDAEKLIELSNQKMASKAIEEKARADKAAAEAAHQRELAAQQEAQQSANRAKMAGEVDKYKALIVNAISQRWILPENVDSTLSSQFRIRLAPDGAVLEVSLTRSSGDTILDRSAQTAIYKASPLPVPSDPATFDLFRDISLTVRPENVRG